MDVFIFWSIIIGGVVIYFVVKSNKQREEEAERTHREEESVRREQSQMRQEAVKQQEAEHLAISTTVKSIVSDSRNAASELPVLLGTAEGFLDEAEHEFNDGAFAPFWDAIERAAFDLATFNNNIELLGRKAQDYRRNTELLEQKRRAFTGGAGRLADAPPSFELGIRDFPDPTLPVERMRSIVRQAQKDFQFATIYEQRKANQLLVSGFSTLGLALSELQDRLESSLDGLASSVSEAISGAGAAQREATSNLLAELKETRDHMERESEARRESERLEREMLDNIQRRRLPPE